jgi:hypothetical protein
VVFQLLDHTDILDIDMESILPLQLGSARETIKEFTRELLTHEKRYSIHLSSLSLWCIQTARSCTHNSTDKGPSAATSGRPQLPLPIIRVDALCFTLLPKGSSQSHTPPDDNLPLRLSCHIAPDLVPEKSSERYSQIDPETLQELLPKVTDEGELACKGNWWCPGTSTYLSVQPEISAAPPTLQQLYFDGKF